VTVLESQSNDDWEIKGVNPSDLKSWMLTLMLPEHQTAEYVNHTANERITAEI
jgi:hypothetical protein